MLKGEIQKGYGLRRRQDHGNENFGRGKHRELRDWRILDGLSTPVTLKSPMLMARVVFVSIVAVTNDHRFSGFNSNNIFSYGFGGQKSKISFSGLKSNWRQSWLLQEALRQIAFLASSSFWRLSESSAQDPFLCSQSQLCNLLPCHIAFFCFPHLGYFRLHLRPIWINPE